MYNTMSTANTAVWYVAKLLRVDPMNSHHKEKIFVLFFFFSFLFIVSIEEDAPIG